MAGLWVGMRREMRARASARGRFRPSAAGWKQGEYGSWDVLLETGPAGHDRGLSKLPGNEARIEPGTADSVRAALQRSLSRRTDRYEGPRFAGYLNPGD